MVLRFTSLLGPYNVLEVVQARFILFAQVFSNLAISPPAESQNQGLLIFKKADGESLIL